MKNSGNLILTDKENNKKIWDTGKQLPNLKKEDAINDDISITFSLNYIITY